MGFAVIVAFIGTEHQDDGSLKTPVRFGREYTAVKLLSIPVAALSPAVRLAWSQC
jgi:hypothetical protein